MWSTILSETVTSSDHLDEKYIDYISTKTREIKSILVKSHYALRQEVVLKIQGLNRNALKNNGYDGASEINDIFDAHYVIIEKRMTELVDYMQQQKQRKVSLFHQYCDGIREIGRQDSSDDDDDCVIISPSQIAITSIDTPWTDIIPKMVINEGTHSLDSGDNSLESQYKGPSPNTNIVLPDSNIFTQTQEQSIPSMPILENVPDIATNQEVESMESDIASDESKYQIPSDSDGESSEQERDAPSGDVEDYEMLYKSGKTLKCIECDHLFKKHSEFINHMDAEHDVKRPYQCSHCTKCYGLRGNLIHHIKSVHAPRYECGVCHKRFGCKSSLKTHCIIHSEERPFKCSQCDSSFKLKRNLTTHIRSVHQNERNFHCDHCSKGFFRKSNLIIHLRVHTEEKPFQCTICGKAFTQKNGLTIHERIHTGEKPYECSKCHKAFICKSTMRMHEKKCHD